MQALVFHGTNQLSLENLPEPRPAANEVVIQVNACGICGSDVHGYLGHSARRSAHVPLVMGHEFSGRIVELGAEVQSNLAVGDRVVVQPQISCGYCRACRSGLNNICPNMSILGIELPGAFAEQVAVPAHRVFLVPEGLNDIDAALTETLAVEVHLFRAFAPPMPRAVVILGAGAQGLLAVQLARLIGAQQIVVSDILPDRLTLAAQMGATRTIQADQEDPVQKVLGLTDGWGADFVVDAVGAAVVRQQGVAMLAPGGTLALVGLGQGETNLNFLPVVGKELTIQGSYCYTDDEFEHALQLIAGGQIQVADMLYIASLNEGVAYFQRLAETPEGLTKVVMKTE